MTVYLGSYRKLKLSLRGEWYARHSSCRLNFLPGWFSLLNPKVIAIMPFCCGMAAPSARSKHCFRLKPVVDRIEGCVNNPNPYLKAGKTYHIPYLARARAFVVPYASYPSVQIYQEGTRSNFQHLAWILSICLQPLSLSALHPSLLHSSLVYAVRACSGRHMFWNRIMPYRYRLLENMMKEHLTSSWISPSSAKCPLATFSIPHHWTVHLLIVSMLPVVGAIPSSNGISANNIFRKDVSTSTSAPSSTTLSASSTSNPGSHASSNTQLVLLISGEFRISVCWCCSKE